MGRGRQQKITGRLVRSKAVENYLPTTASDIQSVKPDQRIGGSVNGYSAGTAEVNQAQFPAFQKVLAFRFSKTGSSRGVSAGMAPPTTIRS